MGIEKTVHNFMKIAAKIVKFGSPFIVMPKKNTTKKNNKKNQTQATKRNKTKHVGSWMIFLMPEFLYAVRTEMQVSAWAWWLSSAIVQVDVLGRMFLLAWWRAAVLRGLVQDTSHELDVVYCQPERLDSRQLLLVRKYGNGFFESFKCTVQARHATPLPHVGC